MTEAKSVKGLAPWALGLTALFVTGVALVLFFLLTVATDQRGYYEAHYTRLLLLNAAVAFVLLLVILWFGVRLALRFKRRRFGSHLLLKLAAIFALVGFAPGLLIYTVSYQFVSRSIESWFDVHVESALGAGLGLGRTALETLAADLGNKTRAAATALSNSTDASAGWSLDRLRDQLSATDVVLWSSAGQPLASAGVSRFKLRPTGPTASQMRQARSQRMWVSIEGLDEQDGLRDAEAINALPFDQAPRVHALALVTATGYGLSEEPRYLQVISRLPAALVADALAVQVAYREYQQRALARDGLKRMYIGTLTLALFLAVFGAVLLAVLLGNQLVRPLLVLAEGMREVAKGDLTPKTSLPARDELAGLTRTFAHMTQELADARHAVQRSMVQVDNARANLQTILDNLTAGVVVLDAQFRILSVNPGATRVLRAPLAAHIGQPLQTVTGLDAFGDWVRDQFDRSFSDQSHHEGGHWQQSHELQAHGLAGVDSHGVVTMIVRGAMLPHDEHLLVFDDVSEIISAQRAQAWGEVARRLAHEIKNPLTPIQLSAERLAMKLEGKLAGPEQALLDKSVRTIVDQVDAMKRLVNEFRDYARLPAAQLAPVDLNALVADIMGLYDASQVPVQLDLAGNCPLVSADAQQVRQVVHNLVQNAQDATPEGAGPVVLQTRVSDSGRWVRLHVLDHGPGFTPAVLQRAFEPYVTSKAKGTGLGLAVVKKIMADHGGRVEISHRQAGERILGAQVSLSFKVANMQHI